MAAGYTRPSMPSAVERLLRQESGFGCARCGHPYMEFHHIVPYAEEAHYRTEDMVALCGNCHVALSRFHRDRQYEVKSNPVNIKNRVFNGALEYDKRDLVFRIGGNWYESCPTILRYQNTPIILCRLDEGQAKISMNLFDPFQRKIFSVTDNNIVFRVSDVWDFEYKHNFAVVRYGPRKIALSIDFRAEEAVIEGNIWVGGLLISLGKEQTTLPGNNIFRNNRTVNCAVGIQLGNPGTVRYRDDFSNFQSTIPRNAGCPCNSRKKFKHCCGSFAA